MNLEDKFVPGLAGIPVTKSKISDIDGEKGILYYRGYPIEQIATLSTFEETALLLLDGELPSKKRLETFTQELIRHRHIKIKIERIMEYMPKAADPMQVLQVGVSLLSSFFTETEVTLDGVYTPQQQFDAAVTIISHVGTLVALWEHLRNGYRSVSPQKNMSYAENFLYMIHGEKPEKYMVDIFDTCLILHAEHTINASTFTAMVTASTLANPCSAIAAGIASLSGPLHGGANKAVINMICEIGTPDKVEQYIDKKLANKEVIWGMGHREYKTKDPRAKILEKMLDDLLGRDKTGSVALETAKKVEVECEKRLAEKGVYPNVDFYSGILYQALGLRSALFVPIFAIARTTGWLAHLMEQLDNNKIFRPTQIYEGYAPRDYIDINKR